MKLLDAIAKNNFVVIGRAGMDMVAHPPGTRSEDALSFTASSSVARPPILLAGICKFGGTASLVTFASAMTVSGVFASTNSTPMGLAASMCAMSESSAIRWPSMKAG
ncbi:MAG: hypothetical protein R3D29_15060 [Nitratireductor sp.]